MSGLLALLDDVAAIAKVAATSVDDVASMAAQAGTKTARIIIDDADNWKGELKGFGGSNNDLWNGVLVNQAVNAVWLKGADFAK